ncbi:protein of unknown function (plasmid) [Rhodovastum atsumiense]|uniref:transposase n=1 Tax=Rhodovastum atsumiense TaxID=504468 RepID=UPI00193B3DD9|nr:transposase [Rhodovastum atsumiense]CAH2605631.1 protein of unknown function [Rhodovastum atsumiense]
MARGRPAFAEPKRKQCLRWHGDEAARRAVYNNRARLLSGVAREAFKLRTEWVERSFALTLDRGGMRRVWLRGREKVQKRYLIHVAGYNLGLIMRLLTGAETPRGLRDRASVWLGAVVTPNGALVLLFSSSAFSHTRSAEGRLLQRAGRLPESRQCHQR